MTELKRACAHLYVEYHTLKNLDGTTYGWWQCDDCETKFVSEGRVAQLESPNAELVEALDDIARWASNEGKSPDHEEALIILLTIGQRAIEAKARGES